MNQQHQDLAIALTRLDEAVPGVVGRTRNDYKLWEITRDRLRKALLVAWLWDTVEQHDESRLPVEDLWLLWAELHGKPTENWAGGYHRPEWTTAVSVIPNQNGMVLGDRAPKRRKGRVVRMWLGWRIKGGTQ